MVLCCIAYLGAKIGKVAMGQVARSRFKDSSKDNTLVDANLGLSK